MSGQVVANPRQSGGISQEPKMAPEKVLMKGNEAIAEAAIRAGCDAYFGYPITPQTEILEYMSRHMIELGRVFVQAESEVAAINMVFGAASTGARVMTASSGPGISLKQEGISYLAGAELPAVIVNIMRCGPGLGGILPEQGDYNQATKGGGHGNYRIMVLAPNSVQEAMDLTALAFNMADKYRNPVMVLADGLIGQIMEPVELKDYAIEIPPKPWAVSGAKDRPKKLVTSLFLNPELSEKHVRSIGDKYEAMAAHEVRFAEYMLDDAEIAVVAYGTPSRVAQTAVRMVRAEGIRAGLFRPITLSPFPYAALRQIAERVKAILVVELSLGQMAEDVKLAVFDRVPITQCNRAGGVVMTPIEVANALGELARR